MLGNCSSNQPRKMDSNVRWEEGLREEVERWHLDSTESQTAQRWKRGRSEAVIHPTSRPAQESGFRKATEPEGP